MRTYAILMPPRYHRRKTLSYRPVLSPMLGPSATPEKNVHTADAPGSCFQLSSRDAGDGVVKRGGACTLIIHDDDGDDDDDRDDDGDIDVDVDDAIACCEYDEAEDSYQDDLSDSDGFNLDNDAGAADDDAGDDAADDGAEILHRSP